MTKNKLLLVDGNSVAFRAFFALHQSLERFKNSSGLHTNALYAFHNMFMNVMDKEQPTHVLVAFDAGKTTFRNEWYDDYKGGRAKTPSEFKEQMPYLRELITALGVKHYELPNYEADDIIGTLAKTVDPQQFDVVILTGDRDLTQLASEHITVDITVKGVSEIEQYTPAFIAEKYNGLTPNQIIDMKGLAGDASDNIPGVTKVGEKTAIKLLNQFGSVEGIYDHIDELKKSKMKENLIADKEQALLSKRLATIETQAPVALKIEDLIYTGKNFDALIAFYQEMNFQSFLEKLAVPDDIKKMEEIQFQYVTEVTSEMFGDEGSLYIEMLEENYHTSDIVGLSWSNGNKTYVTDQIENLENPHFTNWLQDESCRKYVFDAKKTTVALNRYGQTVKGIEFDLLLAAYLLDTNDSSNDIATIAAHYGYHQVETDERVYGKGAKKGLPADEEAFYIHLARKVQTINYLKESLLTELHEKNQLELFKTIELPLAFILAEMEMTGIHVDASRLVAMRTEFAERLHAIEEHIFEQAGERFNLNSPKQLGVILFEKMGLPVIKKTKTGYSTAVDVLEQLREQAPIVEDILVYRQIAKIQSTYVEGLLRMIQADGKVHTRYIQTLTQTGRLSSVDPNLQNIPIRLEEGRKIRQAFVPRKADWVIYSSDYSQIELRVLADTSHDEHLQQAFIDKQDIHTSTAMRVFGVSEAEVTSNMRRDAKAVNFGIVYGISDYGLSQNLGITRKAAQQYIDTYFERYPGVKTYMEEIVKQAKQQGFVETLYHRRRYLPDLNSKNYNIRSFAERTAINTPIQGSAADILKIAMIDLSKRLKEEQLQATMLLQVHDELVFEVPKEEVERLDVLVKDVMNHAVSLAVPLVSDSSWGTTWYDAK